MLFSVHNRKIGDNGRNRRPGINAVVTGNRIGIRTRTNGRRRTRTGLDRFHRTINSNMLNWRRRSSRAVWTFPTRTRCFNREGKIGVTGLATMPTTPRRVGRLQTPRAYCYLTGFLRPNYLRPRRQKRFTERSRSNSQMGAGVSRFSIEIWRIRRGGQFASAGQQSVTSCVGYEWYLSVTRRPPFRQANDCRPKTLPPTIDIDLPIESVLPDITFRSASNKSICIDGMTRINKPNEIVLVPEELVESFTDRCPDATPA